MNEEPARPADTSDETAVIERIMGAPPTGQLGPHHRAIPLLAELNHQVYKLWGRTDELDMRTRRVATIAALATLGAAEELKVHVNGALRNGDMTAEQLGELAAHLTTYIGWPRVRTLGAIIDAAAGSSEPA
jgi:alkylhydroperoxidase/carboxymuconolactone decarboxylase family protein YurZ